MIEDGGSADTSTSDEVCSTGFHSEDNQGFMEYGSQSSELSQLLDEEVNRVKQEEENVVEEMDISLSSDSWHEIMDEVVQEEKDHGIVKKKTARTVMMMLKMINELDHDGDGEYNLNVSEDKKEDKDEICDGLQFLKQLDPDFVCSPRMIVRGIYSGEVLQLVVKRKTEGNLVHWALFDMKQKKQLLSVKAQMEYLFELSSKAQGTSDGVKVLGGWKWLDYKD